MPVGRFFGIGVDGVAEEHELDDRDADDHGEGQPVAPHLDHLLQEDGADALAGGGGGHHPLPPGLRLAHEADEDVFERRLAGRHLDRELFGDLFDASPQRIGVGADDMQVFAEGGDLLDARHAGERPRRGARSAPGDDEGAEPRLLDDLLGGAARDDGAVGDVDDAVAALGLVHVVGGDEHGQPVLGEAVDLVPELAPRLRIDAGGRLVEEQQPRLVHDAGGEREPLLPAAGERAGELVLAARQAEAVERLVDGLAEVRQRIEPRDELEVLADRQILVEGEALRHVADLALDRLGLALDVVAEAGPLAGGRPEQAADQADRRRLAGAVRPEEADDLARRDLEVDIVHDGLVAEAFWSGRGRR